jgi:hypothetical protein
MTSENPAGMSGPEFSEAWQQKVRNVEKQELEEERKEDDERLDRIVDRMGEAASDHEAPDS